MQAKFKITPVIVLLIVLNLINTKQAISQQTQAPDKILYYKGNMADVFVDKALYTQEKSDKFYFHFTLVNKTVKTLGVKMDDFFTLFYPNQWTISDTTFRIVIDEERMQIKPLDPEGKQDIIDQFQVGNFISASPQGSLSWFICFNGGPAKNVKINPGEYFIAVFDGRLLITDGIRVEDYYYDMSAYTEREFAIPYPLLWLTIPKNEKLIINN